MTSEQHIDYDELHQSAMRGLVRTVLTRISKTGLPGEHHFYIAFNTGAPGAIVSKRLKEKYPEEMTIVLQHRFWELIVLEDRFEVKLTFDGIPERLIVPYTAIKVFFDPSVPYGLQFEEPDTESNRAGADRPMRRPQEMAGERAGRTLTKGLADKAERKKPVRKPRSDRNTDITGTDKVEQDVHAGEDVMTSAGTPGQNAKGPQTATGKPSPFSVVSHGESQADKKPDADGATPGQPKVVSLDAFRKK
jgi:uncharacterized protein